MMMPINLPLTPKSSPADGTLARPQSSEFDTTQSPPFGEILKDEEMKLLEEKESSAFSVAAVLAAMQSPTVTEPVPVNDVQDFDAKTVGNVAAATTAGIKTESDGMSATVQPGVPNLQSLPTMPNILPSQPGTGLEKAGGDGKTIETQAGVVTVTDETPAPLNIGSGGETESKLDGEDSRIAGTGLNVENSESGLQSEVNKALKEIQIGLTNKPGSISSASMANQESVETGQAKRVDGKTGVEKVNHEARQELDPMTVTADSTKETVFVNTTEKWSPAQVTVQADEVIQQIMGQMKIKIKSGNTSMHLQLNPKDLGSIDVQMVKSAQGVNVTFVTEQASTGQLLETQINQLRQSLKDAGLQLTGLNINQHDQPKQEGGFFKQGPHFGEYSQRHTPQLETTTSDRGRPERIGGSSNEIDYLI